jgi:hypothetical protein
MGGGGSVPLFVPTLNGTRNVSVLLLAVLQVREALGSKAVCHSVAVGSRRLDIATNQEAAGSSPAGRANLFNELARRRLLASEQ